VKNKLLIFFDYEGTTIRKGQLRSTTVATANGRIGDFSPAAGAAHDMKGDMKRCLAAGMDDYITKPVDLERLRQAVQRWAMATDS
jgi:CheY-like chemotaxis protein